MKDRNTRTTKGEFIVRRLWEDRKKDTHVVKKKNIQ